jgi:hypothetical protein
MSRQDKYNTIKFKKVEKKSHHVNSHHKTINFSLLDSEINQIARFKSLFDEKENEEQ